MRRKLKAVLASEFEIDVRDGLKRAGQKKLPSKYFYDDLGSALFEAITLLPEYGYSQSFACDQMMSWFDDPKTKRIVRSLYRLSGIEHRYSVLKDFKPGDMMNLRPRPDLVHLFDAKTGNRL